MKESANFCKTALHMVALPLLLSGAMTAPLYASFWASSAVPRVAAETDDDASVILGLRFTADVPGTVTAVRFYKATTNTGQHVGSLWSGNGTKLASVTFSNESASGWQQATFSTPVHIDAQSTYVVSYLAPRGNYADDQSFAWSGVGGTPLHVAGSAPGVFTYGSSGFPQATWNSSNYWVDLVFAPDSAPGSRYSISGKVTGSAALLTLSGTASATTRTDSAGNYTFAGLANGRYLIQPTATGFAFSPPTSAATVNGANVSGINFTGSATTPPAEHSVTLNWQSDSSPNIVGYKVYRAAIKGGPYDLLSASPVSATTYIDKNVSSGGTYFYVTTAINSSDIESPYSNAATAVIP